MPSTRDADRRQARLGDAAVADGADEAGPKPELDVVEHPDDVDVVAGSVCRKRSTVGEVEAGARNEGGIDER